MIHIYFIMEVTMSKLDLFRDHLDEREYRYREVTDDAGVTRAFIAQHEIKTIRYLRWFMNFPRKRPL